MLPPAPDSGELDPSTVSLALTFFRTLAPVSPSIASLNLLSALTTLPASPLNPSTATRIHFSNLLFASLLRFSPSAKSLAQEVVPGLAIHPPLTPSASGAFFVPADGTGASVPQQEDPDSDDRPQTLLQTLTEHLSLSFLSRSRAIERGNSREERQWDRLLVGYLSLLSQWLWENPNGVREFLEAGGLSLVSRLQRKGGFDLPRTAAGRTHKSNLRRRSLGAGHVCLPARRMLRVQS